MIQAFGIEDVSQIGPIGGIAALLVVMLRMVWSDRVAARLIEVTLRAEWAKEKAALIAYQDAALATQQRLHDDEVASLNRRIVRLEAEADRRPLR